MTDNKNDNRADTGATTTRHDRRERTGKRPGRPERADRPERNGRREGRSDRREGRRRRGDIRALLLAGLVEGPGHGYELIRRLEDRAEGQWRPSAGSVYPTLQLLEDEGLVRSTEIEGRKVYGLTDEGRTQADEAAFDRLADDEESGGHGTLRTELHQVVMAYKQVDRVGDTAQLEQAAAVLRHTRQVLYRLLADEE